MLKASAGERLSSKLSCKRQKIETVFSQKLILKDRGMKTKNHFDFKRLRDLPLKVLLEEDGVSGRQLSGRSNLDSCPLHPGHDHSCYSPRHNHVRCFVDNTSLSIIDYVMHTKSSQTNYIRQQHVSRIAHQLLTSATKGIEACQKWA